MAELNAAQSALWQAGLAEFNQGAFFAAHEQLEDLWRSDLTPALKTGLQGLIQVAVACVHLQRGNEKGALGVFARAQNNLQTGELPQGHGKNLLIAVSAWQNWLRTPLAERGPAPPWPEFWP